MADAKLMKISWGTLSAIVLAAGASGATVVAVSGQLSSDGTSSRGDDLPPPSASAQGAHAIQEQQATGTPLTEPPSAEDVARALALLRAHLGSQTAVDTAPASDLDAEDAPRNSDELRDAEQAEDPWEQVEGESAAVALARLERAYRAELARNAELERDMESERSAALTKAEGDRLAREEENSRYLAERDTARHEVANRADSSDHADYPDRAHDVGDDEQEAVVASISQYAMNSAIYAPVFIGSAAPPPVETSTKSSAPAPYPVIPRGAFFGVSVPQSNSSSPASSQNKTQVYVSYRPGKAQSPWAPIDMSRHNNPWSATPGVP